MDSRKNFGMEDFGQLLIAMNQELNVLCKNVGCLQDQVNALDSLVRDDVKVRLDVLEERLLVVEAHMAGRTEELEAELDEELKEDESFCEDKENGGEVQVNVERNFDVLDRLQEVEIGFIGQMDQMVASMEFESEADELGEAVKVSFLLFGSEVVEADDGLGKSGKYENKKFLLKNESVEGTSESLDKVGDCLGNDSEVKEKKTKASSKLKGVKGGFLDRVTDPTFAAEQRAKMMEAVGQDPLKLDLFLKRLHGFDDNFDKAGLNRDFSDGSGQNRRLRHADEVAGINGMEWADVNVLGKADGNGNEMYDGNPLVNLKAFFRKLRLFLMQFPFAPTPEQAVAYLVGRLRGRALIAYQAMPAHVQADFDLIEAALKQKFPNDEFVWASEMELQSCYQGPHESVHAFSQRVAELVYAVLDGMPEEEVERNLRRETMYRLREELREYVQEKDPETYEEVLQYARRGEANLQRRQQKYHERFSSGYGVYVVKYGRSVNYDPESHPRAWKCPSEKGLRRSYGKSYGPRSCYVCDAPDHLARNCPWAYERENDGQDWNHGGDQQDVYDGQDWNHERRSCGKSVIDPRRCFVCGEQGHLVRECPYQEQVGNGDVLEEYPQLAGVTGDYGTGQDEAFYGPSDSSDLYGHVYLNSVQLAGHADYGIPDNLQPRMADANVLESPAEDNDVDTGYHRKEMGGFLVTATIDGGEADDQVAAEETVMRYKGLHGSAVSGSHFGGNKGPEFAFGRPDVHQMAEAEVVDELYASPLVKNFSRKVEGKTGHKVHDPGGLSLEGSSCMKSTWSNVVAVNRSFGSFYNVIGVTHDEKIEWQSVSPTGSALKLPTINNSKIKIDKNSSLEVQYDNRFGLFHIETNFETEFPSKILILSPTDRIRFKLLSNLSLSLSNCEIHSLWFTFFKTNSLITKFLDISQITGKEIINIEKCKFWPFSNIIYRLCPGYEVSAANTTTPNHSFSTLINKITEGTTIESKSFTKDNTLSDKILTSSTSKQLPSTTNSGKNGNSQSSNPSSTQAMQNIINTKTISNSNDESPSTLIIDNEKETLESKFADPLISKSSSLLTNSPTTTITKKELSSPFQEAKASATTLTPINLQFISISSSSSEIIREQRSTPMPPSTTQKLTLETTGAGNTVTASTPQIVTDKVWMSSSGVESSKTATTLNIETTATVTTSTYNTQSVTTSTPSISNTNQATTVGDGSTTIAPTSATISTTGSLSKTTTTQISSTLEIKPNTVLTSTTERSERDITQQSSLTTDTKSTSGSMTSTMNNTNEISSSPLSLPSVSPTSTSPPPPPSIAFSQQDSSSPPTTSPPKIFSASSNSATTLKNIKSGCSTTDESGLCKYCTKDLSTKQCIVTVYPQLFDINVKEAKTTVTLQVSKDLDEIGKIECNLINKDTLQNIQIKVKIDDNTIEIEFTPQNGVNEMKLSCLIDETEFLSNKTIFISSFQSLVEHKTPFASGFDSSNEHKTIYVTFKEAIPLQFIYAAGSNNAFCVLDQKSGPKYSAKLETPSVMSCNLNGSVTIGSHKLFAIRQPELADATFQYQIPITFSIYSPTTAPSQNTKTAEFLSSLKGILVKFDLTTDIKNRTFNCSKVFMSSETFGTQAICQMTDSELKITFGAAPTILPHQPLLVRSGALTNAYLDGERPNTTQYDAIELKVPADAITPSITLQEPTAAFACQQNVNLSVTIVSGDAGRNMTYKWKLKSGGTASLGTTLSQTTSSFIQIPTIDIGSGASISVEACNFVNKCSESNTVEIKSSEKTFQFTVSIAGIPSTTLPSSKISLSAIPSFASCNSSRDLSMTNISYEWSINGTSVSHDSVYIVPAKTYAPYSALTITVLAKYWNSEAAAMLEATSEEGIVYGIEGLVGIVDGIERAIASDTELLIDARQSFDPNTGNNNLIHSWTCTKDGGINCTNLDLNWKSKLLVVASGVLKPGQNYTFTDTISNGLGSSTQISVTVHILQGSVPIIQLVPLTEKSLPFDSYIRVQGYVQSKSELSTEWQLFTFPDNLAVDISKVFPQVKRNFSDNGNNAVVSVSFTIPPGNNSKYPEWKGLNPGQYIVRLMATNMVGSSFTEHTFEILPLPKKPTLAMSPMKDMFALQTPIQLSAKDIPPSADKPISLRFGFRTILVNNKTMDKWFRASALDYYKTILAAAWPEPHAACNERVAYQGLLEICSFDGACSQTQSPRFVVQHPLNSSIAFSQILTSATSDITSGDLEGALVKLEAIQREQCNTSIDGTVVDALITKVLTNLQNSTDSDSLLIGVGICTAVINSASKENVDKVMELLLRAQKAAVSSRSTTSTPTRQKRSSTATAMAALPAMSVSPVVESAAETFLISYDSLLTGNQDLSTAYIKMITDFLAGFCVQLDSNRILSAEGNGYTFIQAEGLSPFDENFLNQSYSAANVEKSITFGTNFQSVYKSFKCGESKIATCSNICLATADIAKAALIQNTHLQQYFFSSSYNSITFASAMSDFYLIRFIDPNSGNEVPLTSGAAYNFSIPLLNYAAANYYSCFVFVNGIWRNNMCKSNDFGTKIDSKYFLQCYCEITGVLAVFTVSAPTPKYYPPYNEIELKFNLSTTTACTSAQLSNFLGTLSTNSGVGAERFRNYSCNPGTNISTDPSTIILRLRPPFRFSHISNSFAMQAIKRAVTVGNKMIAYGKVEVTALNATTIYRTLEGDERGRRVPLRIDRSYREVVGGNDTEAAAMAIKWAKNLAKDMNIDSQRFKNPIILMGMLFNFTITLPFEGEATLSDHALSAEELSLWIREQTDYNEIDLRDNIDQRMPVDPLKYSEIVQLAVMSPTNTLMTILAIVLSTVFVLSSLCIGGLVFLKIRTDRLIEQHNRNIRTIQIDAAASSDIPLNVIPFESNGMVVDRHGMISEEMHEAADTVVFGRHGTTRVRHR